MSDSRLTEEEQIALEKTAELWDSLMAMEELNSNLMTEYLHLVHSIQARIMARPEIRLQKTAKIKPS